MMDTLSDLLIKSPFICPYNPFLLAYWSLLALLMIVMACLILATKPIIRKKTINQGEVPNLLSI